MACIKECISKSRCEEALSTKVKLHIIASWYIVHVKVPISYTRYMLGAKHGSVDCAAQIMDPYFARAIHGLRSHSVRTYIHVSQLCTLAISGRQKAARW